MKQEIYTFNQNKLDFVISKNHNIKQIFIGVALSTFVFVLTGVTNKNEVQQKEIEFEKSLNLVTTTELNHKNLKLEIDKYNFKFPKIIQAQAILESNSFKSNICQMNLNLFGMKEAKQRLTTATGTDNNHATYSNWQDSVLDRALFESSYLRTIKTKEQYFDYLGKNYAEDVNYVPKLKNILKQLE